MSLLAPLLTVLIATASSAPRMVIADVVDVSGTDAALARVCTQVAVSEVQADGRFQAMGSAEVAQLLGLERQKQLLGCNDSSSCLAEIGGALGADFLFTSQLGHIGARFRLDVKLLDTRRARVVGSAGEFVSGSQEQVLDLMQRLTRQLLERAPGLPARAVAALAPSTAKKVEPASEPMLRSRVPAWVALGTGAALGIGAGLLALKNRSDYLALEEDPSDADLRESLPTTNLIADVLAAGALVGLGTGAVLFFVASPTPEGSGGEIGVIGRF